MKHNLDDLDLRAAFRAEPETCHQALMTAIRSVKEEEKAVKHLHMRPLLVAAIVIVSMLSVAYAASEIFGLNEFYQGFDISLTPEQQESMIPAKETSYQVGPLTFTIQERIADPYNVHISTKIRPTDKTLALIRLAPDEELLPESMTQDVGTTLAGGKLARQLGFATRITWTEAAEKLELPLYYVRVHLGQYNRRAEMLWDEECSAICVCQALTGKDIINSTVEPELYLEVAQIDPATGEAINTWSTHETYKVPVSKLVATGHYVPETPLVSGDMTLTHLETELYATGMYVYRKYQMPADMPRDIDYPVWDFINETPLLTTDGVSFERGISLSAQYGTNEWPSVVATEMINVTTLPEIIQVGGVNYVLQTQ